MLALLIVAEVALLSVSAVLAYLVLYLVNVLIAQVDGTSPRTPLIRPRRGDAE